MAVFRTYDACLRGLHAADPALPYPLRCALAAPGPRAELLRVKLLAGAAAGAVQGALSAPVSNAAALHPSAPAARAVLLVAAPRGGGRALFRRGGLMCAKDAAGTAAFFAAYDPARRAAAARLRASRAGGGAAAAPQRRGAQPPQQHLPAACGGAAAGLAFVCVTHPLHRLREWHVAAHPLRRSPLRDFVASGLPPATLLRGLPARLPGAVAKGLPLFAYSLVAHPAAWATQAPTLVPAR